MPLIPPSPSKRSKENAPPDRSSYLSFLWEKSERAQPLKEAHPSNEDVTMHTYKNQQQQRQQEAKGPYHYLKSGQAQPVAHHEDVRMRTAKIETQKPRGLEVWEREILAKPEVQRRATVAQICELASRNVAMAEAEADVHRLPRLLL